MNGQLNNQVVLDTLEKVIYKLHSIPANFCQNKASGHCRPSQFNTKIAKK